jgi:two-component system CheB/CheR fusion protein
MEGAKVTGATSGEEALATLDNKVPSLIPSDLGMAGINEYEFIEVRRCPSLSQVKSIALSGFGRQSDVEEALHAGFDAHLTKPVMLALLSGLHACRLGKTARGISRRFAFR